MRAGERRPSQRGGTRPSFSQRERRRDARASGGGEGEAREARVAAARLLARAAAVDWR